jgi:glutamine amidotransferase
LKAQPNATIIDYGRGNLFSIERAVRHAGGKAEITDDPARIASADRLILPGVGAFGEGISKLKEKGIDEAIYQFVQTARPFFGICLGMQLIFNESHEFGLHQGLGLIKGKVIRFQDPRKEGPHFKIPHIEWSKIEFPESIKASNIADSSPWQGTILQGLNSGSYFYFVHSFICVPDDIESALAESTYGEDRFCSVVHKDNIWGCQFHPERSGSNGFSIYQNFLFNL